MTIDPTQGAPKKKSWFARHPIYTVLGVLFIIGSTMSHGGSGGSSVGDTYGAEDTCKGAVKQSLKSPATADFHDLTTTGDNPWDTTGSVDSENGFGALIRSTFTCNTTGDGHTYSSTVTSFVDGGTP